MTTLEATATAWPLGREFWRGRVVRGSAILLLSSGLVAVTNLFYNILIARMLGAAGFGHASALYTLLMLVSAVTLAFQIVTSKFIARNSDVAIQAQTYASFLRRSWHVGLGIATLVIASSAWLKSYLNLPAQHDLVLLAIATGIYIPLGVCRGRMQGSYQFGSLAINVVVEVAVKFTAALLFLEFGFGVTGVTTAILLSIVAAYAVGKPSPEYQAQAGPIKIAPSSEAVQAILYFIGQVILSNLDILLVKHFFAPLQAGVYAAVALVGRVVFMLSWSVVSSMFPVSASHTNARNGRSVLATALLLVTGLTTAFIIAVALVPEPVWAVLLGKKFLLGTVIPFSPLLTEYAAMTGIYSIAVVIMMYEISRRISGVAGVQLGASVLLTLGVYFCHRSLSEVILVQMVVMSALLAAVVIPLLRETEEAEAYDTVLMPLRRLRRVAEEEVVAQFLRSEFYHPDYDPYRQDFAHLVERGNFNHPDENVMRRALLFRRRGRLWRELPSDTTWWEVELTARDLSHLQSFPRNEWKRFTGDGLPLAEMASRVEAELARGDQSPFLRKLGEIASDLHEDDLPDAVLLIGIDEYHPLTIIEGNHRMLAALLVMPESVHRRFRFYCGLSPHMNSCCWYRTDLHSFLRYVRHSIRYMFRDADFFVSRTLREKLSEMEMS